MRSLVIKMRLCIIIIIIIIRQFIWRRNVDTKTMTYDVLQVNFLSHFYLTNLIIQRQTAARKSTFTEGEGQRPRSLRVINVSSNSYSRGSMAHLLEMTSRRPVPQSGHAAEDESGGWDIYGSYACSKLAMMLFTTELNFRHTVDNVICLAAHPGRRGL